MSTPVLPCEVVRDLAALYLDGQASPATARAVRRHLSGCAACRRSYRAYRHAAPAAGAAPEDGPSGADARHTDAAFAPRAGADGCFSPGEDGGALAAAQGGTDAFSAPQQAPLPPKDARPPKGDDPDGYARLAARLRRRTAWLRLARLAFALLMAVAGFAAAKLLHAPADKGTARQGRGDRKCGGAGRQVPTARLPHRPADRVTHGRGADTTHGAVAHPVPSGLRRLATAALRWGEIHLATHGAALLLGLRALKKWIFHKK